MRRSYLPIGEPRRRPPAAVGLGVVLCAAAVFAVQRSREPSSALLATKACAMLTKGQCQTVSECSWKASSAHCFTASESQDDDAARAGGASTQSSVVGADGRGSAASDDDASAAASTDDGSAAASTDDRSAAASADDQSAAADDGDDHPASHIEAHKGHGKPDGDDDETDDRTVNNTKLHIYRDHHVTHHRTTRHNTTTDDDDHGFDDDDAEHFLLLDTDDTPDVLNQTYCGDKVRAPLLPADVGALSARALSARALPRAASQLGRALRLVRFGLAHALCPLPPTSRPDHEEHAELVERDGDV